MRRRSFPSSAAVRKGYPSSFAFRLVIGSDRFKAIEARNAEAPEATIAFKRSTSLSDQDLINGTVASLIRRPLDAVLQSEKGPSGGAETLLWAAVSHRGKCDIGFNPPP